jgi:hypothetical protein
VTDPNLPQGPVWSPPPAAEPRPTDALPATPAAGAPSLALPVTPAPAAPGTTPVSGAVHSRSRSGLLTTLLLAGALVVATAGVAFAVGRVTAPASTSGARGNFGANGTGQFPTGNGGAGGFRGTLGSGGVSLTGTVTAVNGQTLTLTLANGQTVTVDLSGTTTYHTATSATASDVTSGSSVVVQVQATRIAGSGSGPNASFNPGSTRFSATDVTVVSK